ncbi:MAG: Hpt domain-containing protein [Ignavibacteriaceae bacterium]|nr:Hpt domain-containing protein [Ignavibacteriaceae bacterium]
MNNNFKRLSNISHQFKGSSSSLKIKEIFELARTFETYALAKDINDYELTFLEMKKLTSAI